MVADWIRIPFCVNKRGKMNEIGHIYVNLEYFKTLHSILVGIKM